MEDNFDVEKFISLVKTKESIWNYKSQIYGNKIKRRDDWMSVCEAMIPDYKDKSNGEKGAIALEFQTKWRVLRDGFTRSVKNYNKKLEQGSRGKLYVYYDQLHFLHDLYETKAMNIDNSVLSSPSRPKLNKSRKRPKEVVAESSSDEQSDEKEPEAKIPSKSIPEKAYHNNKTTENKDEIKLDEDKQFLLSLLSDFRKIPEDQKLDAKGDIINVIRHYRNTSITTPFQTTGSYYTNDITALATTAADRYYSEQTVSTADSARESSSPIDIKFTN